MISPSILFWPKRRKLSVASYRIRCKNVVDDLLSLGLSVDYYNGELDRLVNFLPRYAPPKILVLSKKTKLHALKHAVEMKRRYKTKLVLDLCDNIFFSGSTGDAIGSDPQEFRMVEALDKFDVVVTPSEFLRDQIAVHLRHDMRFIFIPDAVEKDPTVDALHRWTERKALSELQQLKQSQHSSEIAPGRRLVWFGNHGRESAKNGLYDLEEISQALSVHHAEAPISLTVISNNRQKYRSLFADKTFPTLYQEWNYYTINESLRQHAIALIPVRASDFSMAKSANRLTTALANGLAVCASTIDSYKPFRHIAVLDDWNDGLRNLMNSHDERQRRIDVGLRLIEEQFTQRVISGHWKRLLECRW